MRAFENEVLRKTFGLKREEVRCDWIKLHYSEFRNLFPSANIIFEIELTRGDGWGMGADTRNAYGILVGKPEVKDNLGNLGVEIKMAFAQRGWEELCCIELVQDMDKCCGSSEHGNGTSGSTTVPNSLAVC